MFDQRVGVVLGLLLGVATAAPALAVTAPGTGCLVVNEGLDAASARTGGRIVCQEIQHNGVQLAPEGSETLDAYRVRFERLGEHVVVSVSYESPPGTVARTRRVLLNGPEELTQAGPRVAAAIVNDTPLEDTARVDNLVGEETRRYKKKYGEFLWGAGIFGSTLSTARAAVSPGIELMAMYETQAFGVGVSLRTTFEGSDEDAVYHASFGVNGRYFFIDGDVGPFAGGGLAISHLNVNRYTSDAPYSAGMDGEGFGAFAEGGVEFLRLHGTRLILAVRVDTPFYRLKSHAAYDYDFVTGAPTVSRPAREEYHVPVALSAAYVW